MIRAAAEGVDQDPPIDLSKIDFETLATKFAGRKRSETERLAALLRERTVSAAQRNPTRHELVERIEQLIAEYNAGSLNIDEYLRRLISLSHDLSKEERRAVTEDLTEEELAVFDLLTKPDPILTEEEEEQVKDVAKRLLTHVHEKLVLDWRRKAETLADVQVAIRDVLDELPAEPYCRRLSQHRRRDAPHRCWARWLGRRARARLPPRPAPNGDGFVNWLTTHLTNALGAAAVMRTRARVVTYESGELCRLDVGVSSQPVWARTNKDPRIFYVRMNNSSRPMPESEINAYIADRWSSAAVLSS